MPYPFNIKQANDYGLRRQISEALNEMAEEVFSLEVPTVANQDYNIRYDAPFNGSITKVRTKSQSGTCTVTGKINVTALGGTANSASSSATEQVHSTANTFVKGDILRFTASGNAACLGLAVSFYINRTS